MSKKDNVVKFKGNNNSINIGFIIFFIIIIYVLFNIFSYLTSKPVSVYEVLQGTISTNNVYKGLIIRDENIVYAEQTGYINYYIKNSSKASINDVVYSIDTDGNVSKQITSATEDGTTLDDTMTSEIIDKIDAYAFAYNTNNFDSSINFKNQLSSELSQTLSQNALINLSEIVDNAEANNTFYKYTPSNTGIISYYIDGYEEISDDNFTKENFEGINYNKTNLDNKSEVNILDPVYRIVNDENWSVLIQISNDLAEELNEKQYIKIKFCEDDFTTNAACRIIKKNGQYYLKLSLKHSMIRYINERFTDIELVLNSESGLKIPNSAITTKEFFTIPKDYFVQGQDSNQYGLIINSSNDTSNVVYPTIFNESEDFFYIDSEDIKEGDIIYKSNSSQSYVIGSDKDSLIGVYNINKGYAIFKQINVISQNDDYSIISPKTPYGISLYDHIALDGNKIEENQVIMD